jgi:putative transposase
MPERIARSSWWYNKEHRHSGIALVPPDKLHYCRSAALTAQRAIALDAVFAAHPAGFKGVVPQALERRA